MVLRVEFSVYLVNIFNYCIKSSKGIVAGMVNVGMRHNGTGGQVKGSSEDV